MLIAGREVAPVLPVSSGRDQVTAGVWPLLSPIDKLLITQFMTLVKVAARKANAAIHLGCVRLVHHYTRFGSGRMAAPQQVAEAIHVNVDHRRCEQCQYLRDQEAA